MDDRRSGALPTLRVDHDSVSNCIKIVKIDGEISILMGGCLLNRGIYL